MSEKKKHPLGILLVLDDKESAEQFRQRIASAGLLNPLVWVSTAQDAYEYMAGKGRFEKVARPKPGVIILDLDLPDANGAEFLEFLKQHEKLNALPVIILSDAEATQSPTLLLHYGASGVMFAPLSMDGFLRNMESIGNEWLQFDPAQQTDANGDSPDMPPDA